MGTDKAPNSQQGQSRIVSGSGSVVEVRTSPMSRGTQLAISASLKGGPAAASGSVAVTKKK